MDHQDLARLVTTFLPTDLIEREAESLGIIKRQRKVFLVPLVWTLILGILSVPTSSFASLHRLYVLITAKTLALLGVGLLKEISQPWRSKQPRSAWDVFASMTRDPNSFRERFEDPLVRCSDLRFAP